jgi:hypothetical protein
MNREGRLDDGRTVTGRDESRTQHPRHARHVHSPTAHSVCPLLSLTPPGRYLSVTRCPGRENSSSPFVSSASSLATYARSCAEIPVVIGCRAGLASRVRWYAVPFGSWDTPEGGRRGGRESAERRDGGRERQMKPLRGLARGVDCGQTSNDYTSTSIATSITGSMATNMTASMSTSITMPAAMTRTTTPRPEPRQHAQKQTPTKPHRGHRRTTVPPARLSTPKSFPRVHLTHPEHTSAVSDMAETRTPTTRPKPTTFDSDQLKPTQSDPT